MANTYLPAPGESVALEELSIPKAQDVAHTLQVDILPFVWLVECRRLVQTVDAEIIVFDVEVELGQRKCHDIHRFERIAVIFHRDDNIPPEVLALRTDFPSVPHLNLRKDEFPRSLCLFEEQYSELKLSWTAPGFIERIREWLALTAIGRLHAEDQPLEPLLIGSPWPLVIPFDLFTKIGGDAPEPLTIYAVNGGNNRPVLIADQVGANLTEQYGLKYVAIALQGAPQPHGVIRKQPSNLFELHKFLATANVDLLGELRTRLLVWQSKGYHKDLLNDKLVVIVSLPKTRGKSIAVESTDVWAFMSMESIREIGEHIGIWQLFNGQLGTLHLADQDKRGDQVEILLLNPTYSFSRDNAAHLSGLAHRESRKITTIGLGALGSQVFINLMRMAYGRWTLIDKDYLLPHNLARHGLFGSDIGYSKVEMLVLLANQTVKGDPIAEAIVADVLKPGERAEEVSIALKDADVILDISASVAVARYLARDIESPARRVSLFLNPSGSDLVILVEDMERRATLDFLEMQYYRYLINEPLFRNHLHQGGYRIRYAQSCRDLSSNIPQDLVALYAASGSRALRTIVANKEACIAIWQTDCSDLSTKSTKIDSRKAIEQQLGGWILCTDQYLLDKVRRTRAEKLPNETGGVLIGSFDMQRKVVYVVDMLPSPPDSMEWPTVYVRGCQGLPRNISEIESITAGMLGYIGEWHSHPHNCGCLPSEDDRKAFTWLAKNMNKDGLPALMLIVGDHNQSCWYLEQMP